MCLVLCEDLANRSQFFKAIDALLLQIGNDAGPKADSFRSDFSPVAEDKDASTLKIVADIVGFGFLFVSHGVWHNVSSNAGLSIYVC